MALNGANKQTELDFRAARTPTAKRVNPKDAVRRRKTKSRETEFISCRSDFVSTYASLTFASFGEYKNGIEIRIHELSTFNYSQNLSMCARVCFWDRNLCEF